MSASGGIWDGDTLLVSHHHYKVLYRLKLPKDGKELQFVEARACPFPGQGIARDPKTGGLVGIDRGAKKVLFAEKWANDTDHLPQACCCLWLASAGHHTMYRSSMTIACSRSARK
jgi:hypothetical protein